MGIKNTPKNKTGRWRHKKRVRKKKQVGIIAMGKKEGRLKENNKRTQMEPKTLEAIVRQMEIGRTRRTTRIKHVGNKKKMHNVIQTQRANEGNILSIGKYEV